MRGIVLAGGTGSRLGSLTKYVNKHLLPVGGHPMIHWPLETLRRNGIEDITIVSTPRGVGQIAETIGGNYGPPAKFRSISYRVQDKPGGIAEAITCADDYSDRSVAVILGDNVFLDHVDLFPYKDAWRACCFLKGMALNRLNEFGVPVFESSSGSARPRIIELVEKPESPPSSYAVTGLYIFGCDVFRWPGGTQGRGRNIRNILPSQRGEVEVTSLLNQYAQRNTLYYEIVEGFWGDAGTPEGLDICNSATKSRRTQ